MVQPGVSHCNCCTDGIERCTQKCQEGECAVPEHWSNPESWLCSPEGPVAIWIQHADWLLSNGRDQVRYGMTSAHECCLQAAWL